MICILLDPNSGVLKIFDPKTKEDLSDKFDVNQLAIQDKSGKWLGGWHIGQDITDQIKQAEAEAHRQVTEDQSSEGPELLGGTSEPSEPPSGGRYGRG